MLASGQLPNIVAISGSIISKFIEKKYVLPMDDLIAKYALDMTKNLGHVHNYWRYDDGKIYRARGWFWNDPRYSLSMDVNTLYMRYDILKEMGYAKLDRDAKGDSIITLDEYLKILDQVRFRYPKMTPTLMYDNFAFRVLIASTRVDATGDGLWENRTVKTIYESKDALWPIKWLNKLYTAGYVDKGFATISKMQARAAVASGSAFRTFLGQRGKADGYVLSHQKRLGEAHRDQRLLHRRRRQRVHHFQGQGPGGDHEILQLVRLRRGKSPSQRRGAAHGGYSPSREIRTESIMHYFAQCDGG